MGGGGLQKILMEVGGAPPEPPLQGLQEVILRGWRGAGRGETGEREPESPRCPGEDYFRTRQQNQHILHRSKI